MAKLVINAWNKKFKINKDLYGQFSEHIGRGIYEGIYVGEDSTVENVNGLRCDVVSRCCGGRAAVLRIIIIGRMGLDRKRAERKL